MRRSSNNCIAAPSMCLISLVASRRLRIVVLTHNRAPALAKDKSRTTSRRDEHLTYLCIYICDMVNSTARRLLGVFGVVKTQRRRPRRPHSGPSRRQSRCQATTTMATEAAKCRDIFFDVTAVSECVLRRRGFFAHQVVDNVRCGLPLRPSSLCVSRQGGLGRRERGGG